MRRGRLWFISRRLPAHGLGGMERVVYELAAGLAGRGWSVALVTTRLEQPAGAVPQGVELHALDAPSKLPAGRFARALLRWEEAQRASPPDLILAATFAAGPLVARRRGIPAIFQAHGSSWVEAAVKLRAGDPRGLYRLWLYLSAERGTLRRYDRIVAVGPAVEAYFAARAYRFLEHERIVTIANGIDLAALGGSGASRQVVRAELSVGEDERIVLSAGRLIREKGALDLLRAYAGTRERDRVRILIAGAGRDEPALRDFVRRQGLERVRLLGPVPRGRLIDLVRAADLVAQVGTRPEGLPLIVLEALCLGCPVLVAEGLPLPSFGGEAGVWRARPGDAASISAGLERALGVTVPLGEVAAAARVRFGLEGTLDAYEELFMDVLARRKAGPGAEGGTGAGTGGRKSR